MDRKSIIIHRYEEEMLDIINKTNLMGTSDLQGVIYATLENMYMASVLADRADCA